MNTIEHFSVDNFLNGWRARERHTQTTGFVKVTPDLTKFLADIGPWVEIGAGTGALGKGIREAGGRVVMTDTFQWHDLRIANVGVDWSKEGIIRADAERAGRLVARYPKLGLLSSWPDYKEDWCYRAVRHLKPGQLLAYIGEGDGGCTGDDQLHELLDAEFEVVNGMAVDRWVDSIHDRLVIYRRRVPLALEDRSQSE